MVNILIEEINRCLDNNCHMAALITALTLPDICGKAEYPNKKPSDRYISWYDENIGRYQIPEEHKKKNMPYLSGQVVYSLRNSLLHQGTPNIDNHKYDIQYFELIKQSTTCGSLFCGSYGITTHYSGKDIIGKSRELSISIIDLCTNLCDCVSNYYLNNKEKFNFFNYNIYDCDKKTREVFQIKK